MKLLKEAFYIAKLDEIQVDVLIRNLNSGKQSGYYLGSSDFQTVLYQKRSKWGHQKEMRSISR